MSERRYPDHTKTDHAFRDKADKLVLNKHPWKEYKLHVVVLLLVVISVLIGTHEIPIVNGVGIIVMPLLYALVLGVLLYLWPKFTWVSRKQSAIAEGAMLMFIGPLLAKLAVSSGQSIHILFEVGPALILQEFGHFFGTVLLALPIALWLGFGKEAIGMTHSVGREPNVAVIIDKFGFSSPEARGVLTVFVIGTVIGTIFISMLASICISVLPMHPYAFAMASGVGSASMNAAALAPVLAMFPSHAVQIEAFAGFANLISFCLGIYVSIFITIPFTQKMYEILKPRLRKKKNKASKEKYNYLDDGTKQKVNRNREEIDYELVDGSDSVSYDGFINWTAFLIIFSIIVVVGNCLGFGGEVTRSAVGMIILSVLTLVSMYLERYVPLNISSIVYVSVIGLLLACPWSPVSSFIVYYVGGVNLMAIVTVLLAYVGIGIGKNWDKFKAMGWRAVIVTMCVITGTYIASLLIANSVLVLSGVPF